MFTWPTTRLQREDSGLYLLSSLCSIVDGSKQERGHSASINTPAISPP